jgi:hypothetical protein
MTLLRVLRLIGTGQRAAASQPDVQPEQERQREPGDPVQLRQPGGVVVG